MLRCLLPVLLLLFACGADDADPEATAAEETGPPDVGYAACDDPVQGCDEADCRRREEAGVAYSVCVPPCNEGSDCPIGIGGNPMIRCEAGRCVLGCNLSIPTCPMETTCIDGDPPQCMFPIAP